MSYGDYLQGPISSFDTTGALNQQMQRLNDSRRTRLEGQTEALIRQGAAAAETDQQAKFQTAFNPYRDQWNKTYTPEWNKYQTDWNKQKDWQVRMYDAIDQGTPGVTPPPDEGYRALLSGPGMSEDSYVHNAWDYYLPPLDVKYDQQYTDPDRTRPTNDQIPVAPLLDKISAPSDVTKTGEWNLLQKLQGQEHRNVINNMPRGVSPNNEHFQDFLMATRGLKLQDASMREAEGAYKKAVGVQQSKFDADYGAYHDKYANYDAKRGQWQKAMTDQTNFDKRVDPTMSEYRNVPDLVQNQGNTPPNFAQQVRDAAANPNAVVQALKNEYNTTAKPYGGGRPNVPGFAELEGNIGPPGGQFLGGDFSNNPEKVQDLPSTSPYKKGLAALDLTVNPASDYLTRLRSVELRRDRIKRANNAN